LRSCRVFEDLYHHEAPGGNYARGEASRPSMTHPSPLDLARTAQNMARSASADNAVVFNKVAIVCMGVMAVASVLQVLQPMLRDLTTRRDTDGPRGGCCR